MTLPELKTLLMTLGLPVAYLQWAVGQVPELPYILYYSDEDNNFFADDLVYSEGCAVTVEVYSQNRDLELETLSTFSICGYAGDSPVFRPPRLNA